MWKTHGETGCVNLTLMGYFFVRQTISTHSHLQHISYAFPTSSLLAQLSAHFLILSRHLAHIFHIKATSMCFQNFLHTFSIFSTPSQHFSHFLVFYSKHLNKIFCSILKSRSAALKPGLTPVLFQKYVY